MYNSTFLTLTLDGGKWSAPCLATLPPEKESLVPIWYVSG